MSAGLYPTVAISDAFNAILHLIAAYISFHYQNYLACIGYLTVCFAATIGVLRFGFNENRYAATNGHLADLSAFVGLPCVGYTFLRRISYLQSWNNHLNPTVLMVSLAIIEASSRNFKPNYRDLVKIFVNLLFFVLPVTISSILGKDWVTFAAIIFFVFAGLVVKPERHQYLFGVRRENLFHYMIGIAAYFIALGGK